VLDGSGRARPVLSLEKCNFDHETMEIGFGICSNLIEKKLLLSNPGQNTEVGQINVLEVINM
jgi:hypothetical protein